MKKALIAESLDIVYTELTLVRDQEIEPRIGD